MTKLDGTNYETNIQCQCGLCCGTLQDWQHHRQASGHEQYREISVENLTKQALHTIEGLKTFKKSKLGDTNS